ncbi:uncharacterized protein LOC133821075 [Humulus lupulus]|uniref:uncharacterized protein LOC133821075 n=1 Tax=Humulus lupulus TaxID=3486 RepID=UPI002B401107|nr:uncharacterized protein LOC133821075 [Humulus lupulus]
MYVTRALSLYTRHREALSLAPPEGPNSGYLVIYDGLEYESSTSCCGLCNNNIDISHLPFPQNKVINISDSDFSRGFVFIPVLNQPLSSNRYYAIESHGPNKGKAIKCSKKIDMGTSCFGRPYVQDVNSVSLDPLNTYQQIEIINQKNHCGFTAKSITDGFPPEMLRFKYWTAQMETPKYYQLNHQAQGLNSSLRTILPSLNFPLSSDSSAPVVVGKWYCPFMFVEEVMKLKDQVETSMFYEMTLEQRWVRVFECDNIGNHKK